MHQRTRGEGGGWRGGERVSEREGRKGGEWSGDILVLCEDALQLSQEHLSSLCLQRRERVREDIINCWSTLLPFSLSFV